LSNPTRRQSRTRPAQPREAPASRRAVAGQGRDRRELCRPWAGCRVPAPRLRPRPARDLPQYL